MKILYRPEIDGLRAIAVVAVILYHAKINIFGNQSFKGGFIGVDIFFVISGYLITSIILKELITTGSFSFKYFWERRVRRILPALLFVMVVSLPFAYIYLLPNSFVDFLQSIIYSLGFSSNFYFHFTSQEYGAKSGLLKPFLHTWSLSVEEQFYILFPLFFFFSFKYFKNHLLIIIVISFLVSLFLADIGSRNYKSENFYFLHSRMWELLAGSILAYFKITSGHKSIQEVPSSILTISGLFLIINFIFFYNDNVPHPSLYSLSPIIGVCLIIWFSNKDDIITKILSTKLLVGIGLISYSLYLWHYPIFAFARVTDIVSGSLLNKLLMAMIIFILSFLTYLFLEKPARKKNYKFSIILTIILSLYIFLIIFSLNGVHKEGYKNRLPEIFSKNISPPWDLLKNSNGEICFGNPDGCKFNQSSNKKIYVIGDSHIASLIFDLKNKLVDKNYQFNYMPCPYFPGFNLVRIQVGGIDKNCNDIYYQKLKKKLLQEKDAIFVFGGQFPLYLSNYHFNNQLYSQDKKMWNNRFVPVKENDTIEKSLKENITKISENNKIILIYPIPEVGIDVPRKLLNTIPKELYLVKDYLVPENYISVSYEAYKNRTELSYRMLDSIKNDNIYRVYPHLVFCEVVVKNKCITHDDKNLFYFDDNHPSVKGAELINNLIVNEIRKIEMFLKNK